VVDPDQRQTYATDYSPAYAGELKVPMHALKKLPFDMRKIVARRAAMEIVPGAICNLGAGISTGISAVATEEMILDRIALTNEQGFIGGAPLTGVDSGASQNYDAIVDQPYQFDFYDGGGLDIAFLSFAEVDPSGNVNISRFGSKIVGIGGFINISQNAKRVVFSGTFTSGGLELATILSERLGDGAGVTLIDRGDAFVFGYSKLDVMFGRATPAEVRLPYADCLKPGVRLLRETVTAIDPEARRVTTDAGVHEADVLVVALGADYDFDATPGLAAGGNEFYSTGGAERLRDLLPAFTRGRAIVGVCGAPFKCPPAPSEAALLLHDYLVQRGVRVDCEISPISSRNKVPPSAASNFPRRSDTAPVNAPLKCPNSSLSISSSGIAAQFTSTNGPARRRLNVWMLRATSSLPVPFSPKISTRPFVGAAIATCSRSCAMT